jgi:predicted PurR-regulated permease PerM
MSDRSIPAYAKATIILLGLTLLTLALFFGRDILVPLAFANLLAVLLNPVLQWLERHRVPRILAISITVVLAIIIVVGVAYFITLQMSQFGQALPQLKVKLLQHLSSFQGWLETKFGWTTEKQLTYVRQGFSNITENSSMLLTGTFSVISGVLVLITLIPVYVFLLLLYRNLLIVFLIRIFSKTNTIKVSTILHEIKEVIQSYIVGLLIEATIVAAMNVAGLLILGVDYAVLLGVIGAILNLVPYIGGIVAITLPVLMVMVTKDGLFYPLAVIGVYLFIQFIDNNILVPKVVASKVKINALISILAVLGGGALWGISGMFLSIPVVAILKIIFDRVTPLKPWGLLLGDTIPEESNLQASKLEQSGIIMLETPEK